MTDVDIELIKLAQYNAFATAEKADNPVEVMALLSAMSLAMTLSISKSKDIPIEDEDNFVENVSKVADEQGPVEAMRYLMKVLHLDNPTDETNQ